VRQSNIGQTICVTGWTATVRPPEAITEAEKRASLAAYGDPEILGRFEYDHLVPLELGGATNDPRNLWPEPGPSPNPKDTVEFELREEVCNGRISLARAQREIASSWTKLLPGGATGTPQARPTCTVHAVYSPRYRDYDVYVASNRPEQIVTVTGAGHRRSWHTDPRGGADVYFPGGPGSAGTPIAVAVGGARCSGEL
jgi:hypothetical protein